MRKLIYLIQLIVLGIVYSACHNDDVKLITEGDNLPINEVVEFKLDESSGTTTTETETGSSFEILGRGINRMNGVSGNALFFDGLSNNIEGSIPSSLMPTNQIVMSVWASPKSYPIGTAAMVALTENSSSTGIMIGINEFGQLVVQYFIDGSYAQTVSSQSITKNEWNHIVVGVDALNKETKIYVNKQLIETGNISQGSISWPSGNTNFSIGKHTDDQKMGIFDINYFSGALDEIKVYSGQTTDEVVEFINSRYSNPETVVYEVDIDYSSDTNRPTYHAIPDYGWANESYGLIYANDQYHMFYQKNDVFLGIANQNWGRFTSNDLVNWEEQNAVLWPTENWDKEGIWSGASILLEDGTLAVAYTGVDGIKAGIGTATSNDNYQTLNKNVNNPVIASAPAISDMDFRDPYVWYKDGKYHMVVGSGISTTGGNIVYYESDDFENWTYDGVAFQGQITQGQGQFWEMPVVYEFPNGKEILVVNKTPDGTDARTFYWVGQFENGVFTPDNEEPKNLEIVNGFLSPTVSEDFEGQITAIGIIPDEVDGVFQQEQGWANLFSVPQVWELDGSNELIVKPHPNLIDLRGDSTSYGSLTLDGGSSNYLNNYNSRHFEMEATFNTGDADKFGFIIGKSSDGQEEYKVYYDMMNQEWVVDASNSSLSDLVRKDVRKGSYAISAGNSVNVKVFVDGSVLEVFVDDKAHFTGRFFPTLESATGVDVFATGGTAIADVTIYEINN
jgi:sucrose-6-phosphate hydrolase SacC (GH32 family)